MQNKLAYTTFVAPNVSKTWLDRNGFRYMEAYSSKDDGDVYTMRFPVMNWNVYITVEAEIMVNTKTKEVKINCFDKGTRSIYGHWYFTNRNDFEPVVYKINEVINTKIHKLGMKEIKNGEDSKV